VTTTATTVLTASDIGSLLHEPGPVIDLLEHGFTSVVPDEDGPRRVRTSLPGPGTATALLPGLLPDIPAYTVKVNAKFPAARPALRGLVCLHSLQDGRLLALLDSASVTAWRTGMAAALVTDRLARRSADRLAIVGAGTQARLVVEGLSHLRRVRRVSICDTDPKAAGNFAQWVNATTGARCTVAATPAAATRDSDVVVTATWSREPLISQDDVYGGQHVTSLGADEPGKRELSAGLLTQALLVVDDVALAREMGAVGTGGLDADVVDATSADVLAGKHPGRTSDAQVTVYSPVGLPWQDLAVSWHLYHLASVHGLGRRLDLLA
jgi:alanine dehydrogenase